MNDEQVLNELLQGQARMEEQIKTLFRRQDALDALTETVQKLAVALEKQGMALVSTERKLDGVKRDVDELRDKPARRWDTLIAALISALVGFALARMGLK